MYFLVHQLSSVYMGKREKAAPFLNFTFLVEGDSTAEVAEKLGVDYNSKDGERLFIPASSFQKIEEEDKSTSWVYERGNFRLKMHTLRSDNPYRLNEIELGIRQVELFSERVAQTV